MSYREGDRVLGRYEIISEHGKGGFGRIYRARQITTGQVVAIKTLQRAAGDEDQERFQAEMKVLGGLSHPNIMQLLDSGTDRDNLLIVVEFIEGLTLEQYIKANGPMSPKLVRRLLGQILEALIHAHKQGIIHRDLKPANIMITRDEPPVAKLLDFGIATATDSYGEQWHVKTATGLVAGTPAYLAPETLTTDPKTKKSRKADERSDIYSLGLIMIECLTGQPARQIASLGDILTKSDKMPIPHEVLASPIGKTLSAAVQKEPRERYQSAQEFYAALEQLGELSALPLLSKDVLDPDAPTTLTPRPETHTYSSGWGYTGEVSAGGKGQLIFLGALGLGIIAALLVFASPYLSPARDPSTVATPAPRPPRQPARTAAVDTPPDPRPEPPVEPAQTRGVEARMTAWKVSVTPGAAQVMQDGKRICQEQAPCIIPRTDDEQTAQLTITASGHTPQTLTLTPKALEVSVRLERVAPAPARPKPAPRPEPKREPRPRASVASPTPVKPRPATKPTPDAKPKLAPLVIEE